MLFHASVVINSLFSSFPVQRVWSRDQTRQVTQSAILVHPHSFLESKETTKKATGFRVPTSIKGHPTTGIMQSEESTTTTDELDNMHYGAQAQGSGVLDPTTIEEGEFEAMAGDHDAHGLKRQADSDDDGDNSMLVEERPKKKTRGRVKIEMKFISNKLRRYTTFSKRKTGIMKKVR